MHAPFLTLTGGTLVSGYAVIFIAMLIEGPATTAAGAFAASLGYLNLFLVVALALLGNFIPDVFYYSLGWHGGRPFAERSGHKFGLTGERIERLENFSEKHIGKSLFIIKLTPFLPFPGLVALGATRIPIRKMVLWGLLIDVPSVFLYAVVGFYAGAAYHAIVDRFERFSVIGLFVAVAVFFLFSFIYKWIGKRVAARIREGEKL